MHSLIITGMACLPSSYKTPNSALKSNFMTLSGIIFYQASFIASFVLNAPIGYITMGISIFVVSACTYPLYLLKGKISKKIY